MSNTNNENIDPFTIRPSERFNAYTETLYLLPDSIAGFNLKPYLQYVNRYPKDLPPAPKGFEYSSRIDSILDPYVYKVEDLPIQAHYILKGLNNSDFYYLYPNNTSKYYRIEPVSKDIDLNSKTIKYPRYLRPIKEVDYTEEDFKKALDYNRQLYIDYYDSYINDFNNNPDNYSITPTTVAARDTSMMHNSGTRNIYDFAGPTPNTYLGRTQFPGLGYQYHYMYDPNAKDVIDHFTVRPTKDDFNSTVETEDVINPPDFSLTDNTLSDGLMDSNEEYNLWMNGGDLLERELNKIDNLADSIPSYNPKPNTLYNSPLGRVTDLFQYDSPDRIPMHNYTTYHYDGPDLFTVELQIPDYFSNEWKNLESASSPQSTRLPLSGVRSNKEDAMSSNLVAPITYNGEQKYVTTLDRLLKDSLRINGLENRTNRIGDLLSLAIGDARRDNLKKYYDDDLLWWWLRGSYNKKLDQFNNLSLPINIGDFPLGRYGEKGLLDTIDTPITFHPKSIGIRKLTPSEYAYHKHGIVNVDSSDKSHFNSELYSIGINEQEPPNNSNILDNTFVSLEANRLYGNISPEVYAQKLNAVGTYLHNNDVPANALHYYNHPHSRFLNTLKHEGDHAMTTYRDRAHEGYKPNTHDKTVFEAGLGVISRKPSEYESPYSPYGYSLSSVAETLRALHDFKVGWARHLAATTDMTPELIVAKVLDPNAALLFMDLIYGEPSVDQPGQKYYAENSFNFPSTMAPKATELTTARSIRGLEPIYKHVTGKPSYPNIYEKFYDPIIYKMSPNSRGHSPELLNWLRYKANESLRYDDAVEKSLLNQKQRKQFWDIIYPQVNNNLYTNSNNNMV